MASVTAVPATSTALPLAIDALVKRFGALTAVAGVTLQVRAAECLGLLGPNGAGKSTVIRAIVGRVIPDAGRITVFARRPTPPLPARPSAGCRRNSPSIRASPRKKTS